jgi:hypothetical protein
MQLFSADSSQHISGNFPDLCAVLFLLAYFFPKIKLDDSILPHDIRCSPNWDRIDSMRTGIASHDLFNPHIPQALEHPPTTIARQNAITCTIANGHPKPYTLAALIPGRKSGRIFSICRLSKEHAAVPLPESQRERK